MGVRQASNVAHCERMTNGGSYFGDCQDWRDLYHPLCMIIGAAAVAAFRQHEIDCASARLATMITHNTKKISRSLYGHEAFSFPPSALFLLAD